MGNVPQTVTDAYDPSIIRGLGLITLEFSRMEAAVQRIAGMLISPHQFVGEMAVAEENLVRLVERTRALVEARLRPGALQTSLQNWLGEVDDLRADRNGVVHALWAERAITIKVAVRRGKLQHVNKERSAEDLLGLARRMWNVHTEGEFLAMDLALAGCGNVMRVSAQGTTHAPATPEYKLLDVVPMRRPRGPHRWPGEPHA